MRVGRPILLKSVIKEELRRNFGTKSYPPIHFFYYLMLDFWMGAIVFYPLIIACFRGTWQCLDQLSEFLLPVQKYDYTGTYCCLGMGSIFSLTISMVNQYLDRKIKPDYHDFWLSWTEVRFFLVSRIFTLFSLYTEVLLWKGFWELLDRIFVNYGWQVTLSITGFTVMFLLTIGSLRAVMGSPLGTGYFVDIDNCYLYITTMWQMEVSLLLQLKKTYL